MFSFRNVKLPVRRELCSSLQIIKGVGWHKSIFICSRFGFPYPFFFGNMNFYQFLLLAFLLKYMVQSFIRIKRIISARIKLLITTGTFRGFRHRDFLPVRGQRTRSNAGVRKSSRYPKKLF